MIRKVNNKNLIISILIILLLSLGVGYAAFSDTLTISGTANAKGTFDLEFQNAEIVKNIGADTEKTTAVIGVDGDTLTVNAADLAYPGSGVEFAVDIVNVGSIPAEIRSVAPTNITGSDKIKVTGLEEIKVGHPKIEVGDRCNIHFTVEWPLEVGEIPEAESSISFGLQIEYVQATGEIFDGKASHTDSDEEGNTVTGGEVEQPEEPIPTVKEGVLTEIIVAEDYGKSINYVATVKSTKVSNWKVLYNDKSHIYLILDDFLQNNLVPSSAGLSTSGTHVVNSQTDRTTLLNGLKTESYWSEFANGVSGATATGTPTFELIMKSYNEKYNTSLNVDPTISGAFAIGNKDALYVPHTNSYNDVKYYWLASPY